MAWPLVRRTQDEVERFAEIGRRRARRVFNWGWLREAVLTGALAGVLAGFTMPLIALLWSVISSHSPWAAPRAIAAMFLGEEYLGEAFVLRPVVYGTAIHLIFSAAFGVAFIVASGFLGQRTGRAEQVFAGIVWGAGRWISNTYVIAPGLPGGALITRAMPDWVWLLDHLAYGLLLALFCQQARTWYAAKAGGEWGR